MRLLAKLLLGVGVLFLLSVGLTTAAMPASTGAIDACYVPGVGTLRVINYEAGKRCTAKERRLTWNQQAPAPPVQPLPSTPPVLYWTAVATGEASSQAGLRQVAVCPAGYRVMGGGYTLGGEAGATLVTSSRRSTEASAEGSIDTWEVDVVRTDGQPGFISFEVQAHCVGGMTQGED